MACSTAGAARPDPAMETRPAAAFGDTPLGR